METSIEKSFINKSTQAERNSAFEILRIIAIVFIIAHHFSVHGGFDFSGLESSGLTIFNSSWVSFIAQLGKVGVNIFVLISAYYLIDNNRFKIKKLLSIILEMITFSTIIGVTFWIVDQKAFSLSLLKSLFLPFGSDVWWFMTTYLLLYILSPLLNLGIRAMNKTMHAVFLIVFLFIWSFMPTFFSEGYGFSNIGWFITLYLVGSYIKLYEIKLKMKPWLGILVSAGLFILTFGIKSTIVGLLGYENLIAEYLSGCLNLIDMNNFIQVCCTILLFLSFKEIQMKSYKTINLIASTTLAIYLLHDQSDIRHFLWIDLFKNNNYAGSPFLFIYSIGVILAVFAVGLIIGLIYRYTFAIVYNKLLNYLDRKIFYKLDNIFNSKNE